MIRKTVGNGKSSDSIAPPPTEPSTEPIRPTPFAQLTPVARQSVG